MGMWQKTLFYLGLVDEDDPGSYAAPGAQQPAEGRSVQQQPMQGRTDVAVRRKPARGVEPQQRPEPTLPTGGTEVKGRRVEPPMTTRGRIRTTSADSALADAGVVVRPPDAPLVRT
ncbi:MAG: hypothetical protein IH941_12030, partial [Acidobacteria bacterium]|nr:hypothetical protein [Acidobacteriota bacterium]